MSSLQWMHPEWALPLASILAGLALALVAFARRTARRQRRLLPGHPARLGRWLSRDFMLWLALAAIAVAAVGPRIGETRLRVPATGVDVVLLLDLSRSMDAADVAPSRLARARRAAAGLLERLDPGDRVALAAFADVGVLLTPLTPDRAVLTELLSGLDTSLILPSRSRPAQGLAAAFDAFESGSERPRIVVLLSDGEDEGRSATLDAAREAVRREVRLVTLAFGSEAGAQLLDHGLPLVDSRGRTVVTRRDAEALAALAATTDGNGFVADEWGEVDVDAIVAAIGREGRAGDGGFVERRVRSVRVVPFVLVALVLLVLESMPRWGRPSPRGLVPAAALLLAWPAPAGDDPIRALEARLRQQPDDPALWVELGAERLERGRRDAAVRAFLAGALRAETPDAAARAYYDLGVAELERADWPAARDAFFDALALDPDDERARFNLEWTLQALAQQGPTEQPTEDPDEGEPERPSEAPPHERPPDEEEGESDALAPRDLSESQQERLLERIVDDPSAMLRASLAEQNPPRRGRGVVAW